MTYDDILPAAAYYSVANAAYYSVAKALSDGRGKRVKPTDVHCRYCGAGPGETCTRWHKRKGRQRRKLPHRDRVYDARCATDALRALTSGGEAK